MTIEDPNEAYDIATKVAELLQAAAELNAAEQVYETKKDEAFKAEAAKRNAHKKVTELRASRNAFVVELAPHFQVTELGDLAGVAHSQVSRLFSDSEKPLPKAGQRGKVHRKPTSR